ncbi:hypothetical protein HU200_047108 [Digitaria exilis]|uniref:Uncharacterized protein n=1 Tax=Digitaria exilis TaxID=1010633 RepID=A0A835AV84_9POAL|nr:hypothetical protein HU200_047108 [Digitaria exilis]
MGTRLYCNFAYQITVIPMVKHAIVASPKLTLLVTTQGTSAGPTATFATPNAPVRTVRSIGSTLPDAGC